MKEEIKNFREQIMEEEERLKEQGIELNLP